MARSEGFNIYRSALFAWIMARSISLNISRRGSFGWKREEEDEKENNLIARLKTIYKKISKQIKAR